MGGKDPIADVIDVVQDGNDAKKVYLGDLHVSRVATSTQLVPVWVKASGKLAFDAPTKRNDSNKLVQLWNEYFFLNQVASPFLVRALALRTKPELPASVQNALTHYLRIPLDTSVRKGQNPRQGLLLPVTTFLMAKPVEVFMVMEQFPSMSLATWRIEKHKKVRRSQLLQIMFACASAVDALHDLNLIHNHIRLESFLLRESDLFVKLIDCGLMQHVDYWPAVHVRHHDEFAAPELHQGRSNGSFASDMYSLGVVFDRLVKSTIGAKCRRLPTDAIAILIEQLLVETPEKRPTAADVVSRLSDPEFMIAQNSTFPRLATEEEFEAVNRSFSLTIDRSTPTSILSSLREKVVCLSAGVFAVENSPSDKDQTRQRSKRSGRSSLSLEMPPLHRQVSRESDSSSRATPSPLAEMSFQQMFPTNTKHSEFVDWFTCRCCEFNDSPSNV